MKMLRDHELFVQLCEKRSILPLPEISDAVKISSKTGELRLACLSIMVPMCEIISQMLVSSSTIKTVDLSDCMLLSKGLGSILNALCEGSSVTSLILKGNNVNGPVVAQLGQVFMHNNTLKKLQMEWNSIGSHSESFAVFCDGLAKNHSIEEIDLRYNQIAPRCAESLCKVIRWNKSLKNLDLSWNTLGLQGGELILNAMRENKSIVMLGLRGNCMPDEIVQAIENCTYQHRCRKAEVEANFSKRIEIAKSIAKSTTKETLRAPEDAQKSEEALLSEGRKTSFSDNGTGLPRTKNPKKKKKRVRLRTSLVHEDPRESSAEFAEDSNDDSLVVVPTARSKSSEVVIDDENLRTDDLDCKIVALNEMLKERASVIDLLTAEIAAKTSQVETALAQVNELQEEMKRMQEEREKFQMEKEKEISESQKMRKEWEDNCRRVQQDFESFQEKCARSKKETEAKVRRYERDIHKSSVEIGLLRDKLMSITQAYEDLLSKDKSEMHRLRRESKERENRSKLEVTLLKTTLKETTQALDECQMQLQKSRNELREHFEKETTLKGKLSESEHILARYARTEENFQKVKEEKETLEEKLADSQRMVATLQRQVGNLQGELIEPQRRYDFLKEQFTQEKQKSDRLKDELSEERARLKEQNAQIEKMTAQISALNAQFNEFQNNQAEALRQAEKEKKQLKDTVARKEHELSELKADEVQRAGQLYAAFNKYLSSIGPNPIL